MNKSDFSENLKSNGLKSTQHRIDILNIIEKSSQPIAAEKIFQYQRPALPGSGAEGSSAGHERDCHAGHAGQRWNAGEAAHPGGG